MSKERLSAKGMNPFTVYNSTYIPFIRIRKRSAVSVVRVRMRILKKKNPIYLSTIFVKLDIL